MYEEILDMVDVNRLSRNFFEVPPTKWNDLTEEDIRYLYIELNLSIGEIKAILPTCSMSHFDRIRKQYNITKPLKMAIAARNRTCLRKYGVDNISKSEYFKNLWEEEGDQWVKKQRENTKAKYGVECIFSDKNRMKKAYQGKLGVDNPAHLASTTEKRRQTCLEKYGAYTYRSSEYYKERKPEFKEKAEQTCFEHYGVTNAMKSPELKKKSKLARLKSGKATSSKPEDRIYEKILEKYPDCIHGYGEEQRYPFICDFYIPSLDLFIEYQESWVHGFHPYNPEDPKDQETVKLWKEKAKEINSKGKPKDSYKGAIAVWTVRDPLKRETAKKNNLNWKEFFTEEAAYAWLNQAR